ncbi:MAG: copper amine oxidase N-terminal domain-containing protein, partial [Clostridiales bacterium]|nr:copper amine oxidase N-terminal domain-containing protein [Clostridiales bacterium]
MKIFKASIAVFIALYCYRVPILAQTTDINLNTVIVNDKRYIKFENDNNLIDPTEVQALFSIDGDIVTDKFPIINANCPLLPVSPLISREALSWDNKTKILNIQYGEKNIVLTAGSLNAYIGDELYILDTEPVIINSNFYAPTKFLAGALNYSFEYKAIGLDGLSPSGYMPLIMLKSKN